MTAKEILLLVKYDLDSGFKNPERHIERYARSYAREQNVALLKACNMAIEIIKVQVGRDWESIPDIKIIQQLITKAKGGNMR
jgi:hypothetical protein